MQDSTVITLVFSCLSVVITVVTCAVWIKGQFGNLGERLAKAETLHKSLHDRVEKLEDAREHDIRQHLARSGIV